MEKLEAKLKTQISDAERVSDFQRKIYRKAKQEKTFRFYILYDKISLRHFLREAYKQCKANGGSPGIDGITFKGIEAEGVGEFLEDIREELRKETYKPQPVKRVEIPKANGKTRPLGIPTIKDRVIQTAVKMVIEPIFEADFEESSYGFRPKRSAKDAVTEIKRTLNEGKTEVYDADISAYFDTIPHDKLMKIIEQRISDFRMLRIIKTWLKAPVIINNRPTGGKKNKLGTPQGGVISPLLANIYLNLVDKMVGGENGIFKKTGTKIIRYADDFVLMSKKITKETIDRLHQLLEKMELRVNMEKTKTVNTCEKSFNFLGFTYRYSKDLHGRQKKYWNIEPSKKSQKKIREKIKDCLISNRSKPAELLAAELNKRIRGWLNYFSIEKVSYPAKAKRNLRYYLATKLKGYYRRKSQRKCKRYSQDAFRILVEKYGLIDPTTYA